MTVKRVTRVHKIVPDACPSGRYSAERQAQIWPKKADNCLISRLITAFQCIII